MEIFIFQEPGYYETGKFGIRLETALLTINATTKVCLRFLFVQEIVNPYVLLNTLANPSLAATPYRPYITYCKELLIQVN